MTQDKPLPQTLEQAIRYFTEEATCIDFVATLRWPQGITCPRCKAKDANFMTSRRLWLCKGCRKQFSVKVGTIFEDSPIPLSKWLAAIWMIVNAKNGVSSYEIARSLGVTQKSAWFMMHRIRLALHKGSLDKKLLGDVEVDETYIGGKARNMHRDKQKKILAREGSFRKAVVVGMLERKGEVRAEVINCASAKFLKQEVRKHVAQGSHLFTDELAAYTGLRIDYAHRVIHHAEQYVKGNVHINSIENFWSLLKRGIKGTYVSVEPFHLFRYLDEQSFRFNTRKGNDQARFLAAMSTVGGRRITYQRQRLIGQTSH